MAHATLHLPLLAAPSHSARIGHDPHLHLFHVPFTTHFLTRYQSNAVWDHGAEQSHKVVINRPRPFLDKLPTSITSCSYRSNRSPPRRGNNSMDNGAAAGRWLQRSQPYALQAFRFLCRFKQLLLLEQLALAGVWVGGAERSSKANDDGLSGGISKSQSEVNNGLRTAWMETRLEPALRSALSERRERMKRLLEDVRRLAGPFGKMMVLPRVAVETRGVATAGWDVSMVPSQRDIVRGKGVYNNMPISAYFFVPSTGILYKFNPMNSNTPSWTRLLLPHQNYRASRNG